MPKPPEWDEQRARELAGPEGMDANALEMRTALKGALAEVDRLRSLKIAIESPGGGWVSGGPEMPPVEVAGSDDWLEMQRRDYLDRLIYALRCHPERARMVRMALAEAGE